MRPLCPTALLGLLAASLLVGCAAGASTAQATSPTVEALNAQVASLNQQIAQLQPTATTAPTLQPTPEPTVKPTDEPTETPEPEPTIEPTATPPPEPRIFPTRTPRPITASDAAPCALGQIKGNKSSKIYHVPGGGSYSQTKANVECFDSEAQAQAAGYRRARN
jgi:outer membrane biosynthesis protein TonB